MTSTSHRQLPPARRYEDLEGGAGRAIYYRPERFRPRALWSRMDPSVEVGGRSVRLNDISSTGLSFWTTGREAAPTTRRRLPVRLRLGDVTAFAATGEVVRHEPRDGRGTKVALRFLDDHAIPHKLRRLHDRLFFERSATLGLEAYRSVPGPYRAVCNDALFFVRHWKRVLDEREEQVRNEGHRGLEGRLAEAEGLAEERMRAEWREIRARANEVSRELVDGEAFLASKQYTETCLMPALRASPFMWRSYAKPQGYPGDYQAMSWMYEGARRGDTMFARLFDQLGLEERLAHTVPARKRYLVREIRECAARRCLESSRPVRIVSLGAGPAQEIVDYLKTALPGPELEFTLIDQDDQALAFAHERVIAAALPHGDRVSVRCRHVSFRQVFSMPALLEEVRGADLLYAAGIFDYLRDDTARSLLNECSGLLGSTGRLVVGNAAAAPDVRWVPEFVFDWTMIYRSPEELRGLARDVKGCADIGIERDESGTWLFLTLQRGA